MKEKETIRTYYWFTKCSFGHRLGNWIASWLTLVDSLVGIITFGYFNTQLTFWWIDCRLFHCPFFYDNPKNEKET